MKNNKKGFTLMEMLIVVAIIAVLVAIAIPVLNGALEKSREATDAANLRAAYAEVMICALNEEGSTNVTKNADGTYTATVDPTQELSGWDSSASLENIGGIEIGDIPAVTKVGADEGTWTVTYSTAAGATITKTDAGA